MATGNAALGTARKAVCRGAGGHDGDELGGGSGDKERGGAVVVDGVAVMGREANPGAQPMLSIGLATKVYLRPGATDLRQGYEGLYQLVRTVMGQDPLSGEVYAFCNRGRTRLKLLVWDGSGLWLCAKRLEQGR